MANRVLSFQTQQKPDLVSREVYRDIDMTARHGKVSKLVNVKAVQNSIRNIFTWIPGERIINPEFGSKLAYYVYQPMTPANQEMIVAEIRHCTSKWEPRVVIDKVVNVTNTDDRENSTVRLDIHYHIIGLDGSNQVYQYDVPVHVS